MMSYKVLLAACIVMAASGAMADEGSKCDCGIFKYPSPDTTKESPLASKTPQFNFECNADGKESCANMCKALAQASKEDGPKKLCEILGDTTEAFMPAVYYKACDDDQWTYTGLKPTLEVCCKAKEPVACA